MKDKNQKGEPHIEALLQYADNIIATLREPFLVLDKNLKVISANQAFYATFKVVEKETMGRLLPDLGDRQWNIPKLLQLLKEILPEKKNVKDYEVEHKFEQIGERTMVLNACQVRVPKKIAGMIGVGVIEEELILLAIEDITEHKRLQVELKESEERYRRAFETSRDGLLLVHKTEGDILNSNESAQALLGYSQEEFLKKKLWEIGVTKDDKDFHEMMSRLEKDGVIDYEDAPVKTKKGLIVNSEVFLVNKAKVLQCNIRNIVERKRLEDELAKAKEMQYRTLIENLPQKVFLKDKNSVYVSCNENYAKDLKIKPEEIAGKTDYDFFPKNLAEKYREDDRRIMGAGETENIEEEYMVMKDFLRGVQKAVINTVKVPVRDKNGNVTGLFGLFWDITERKKTEEDQRRLVAIIEATPDFVGFADANDKHVIYINKAGRKMCGIGDYEDVTKLKIYDIHPEWTNKMFAEEILPTAMRDGAWKGECAFLNIRDGREIPVSMVLSSHKTSSGEVEIFSTISRDITKRKQAEEELKKSEIKFRSLVENIPDKVFIKDKDLVYIFCNKNYADSLGIKVEEITGKTDFDLFPRDLSEKYRGDDKRIMETGRTEEIEEKYVEKGKERWASTVKTPYKNGAGDTIGALGAFRDITERKRLEEDMRRADVLKTTTEIKSKFTSIVSHEFRSPMAVIKESVNLVLEGLVGSVTPEQKDILDIAKNNIDRLGRLINNVLDFQKIKAGKMELNIKEHDISEMILATSKEMNILAEEKGLSFTVNIDENMPRIMFDEDKIIQVLTNLLSNAIKFTEKGSISVTAEQEYNMVHVMVQDAGFGIQAEDMDKLFQTFEQLGGGPGKKRSGTGLGLVISKEIIQAHNGKIWAESQFGKGSTFHFALPIKERRG